MDYFFVDAGNGVKKGWGDLLADLCEVNEYTPYCQESDFYLVFKHIIVSLLLECDIVLLDSDYSTEEIKRLLGDSEPISHRKLSSRILDNSQTKEMLLERLNQVGTSWKMTMFTSGTTGIPKKISHTFQTITRFVKTLEKNRNDIWGYAYNPTHMAGVQVFFQALLNGNLIIRLFGLPKDQILKMISDYSISNISATPSFYRLLLPANDIFPSVTRITSGGEKFDEKMSSLLSRYFPNAKVTNVYASTEAGTLLAASGNEFKLKEEYAELIKVENNELFIHRNLMGVSEAINSEWYPTGDLVEIVSENPISFKFLSRKNELINVGGYKVNPTEVEETIREIYGVVDVRVFAKSNSVLGNIVCCEVVRNNLTLDESVIRNQLQTRLQEFKIPRMVRFVEALSTTRTGKLKRS